MFAVPRAGVHPFATHGISRHGLLNDECLQRARPRADTCTGSHPTCKAAARSKSQSICARVAVFGCTWGSGSSATPLPLPASSCIPALSVSQLLLSHACYVLIQCNCNYYTGSTLPSKCAGTQEPLHPLLRNPRRTLCEIHTHTIMHNLAVHRTTRFCSHYFSAAATAESTRVYGQKVHI